MGAVSQKTRCYLAPCPVDCKLSAWSEPSRCSAECKKCQIWKGEVCTKYFPLTCTYEKGIVYTHHVNDVHDNELFMCYHNYVTEVCTCLCWPKTVVKGSVRSSSVDNFKPSA